MERDIEDLRRQRDLAQSQLELERRANKVQKVVGNWNDHITYVKP